MHDGWGHKCLEADGTGMPWASREFGPSPAINMSYLEIREYFRKQKSSLMPKYRQAEGQFSCSVIPTPNHFDLGKNNRKMSICEVLAAEIDIRASRNVLHEQVHRYAEGQYRAKT